MLVLSRKQNEEVLSGDNFSLKILSVVRNKVRVGIMAPNAAETCRAELELCGDLSDELVRNLGSEADSSSRRCSSARHKAHLTR